MVSKRQDSSPTRGGKSDHDVFYREPDALHREVKREALFSRSIAMRKDHLRGRGLARERKREKGAAR